jgi:hypothetical protein
MFRSGRLYLSLCVGQSWEEQVEKHRDDSNHDQELFVAEERLAGQINFRPDIRFSL